MPTNWDVLEDGQITWEELLTLLFRRRFTGPLTVHFHKGYARLYEVGRPKKLRFSHPGLTSASKYVENSVDQGPE